MSNFFSKFVICVAFSMCFVLSFACFPDIGRISDEEEIIADSTLMMTNKFTKNWEITALADVQTYQAERSQFSMDVFPLWIPIDLWLTFVL